MPVCIIAMRTIIIGSRSAFLLPIKVFWAKVFMKHVGLTSVIYCCHHFSKMFFKIARLSSISLGNRFSAIGINMFIGYFIVPALIRYTLVCVSDKGSVSMITLAV